MGSALTCTQFLLLSALLVNARFWCSSNAAERGLLAALSAVPVQISGTMGIRSSGLQEVVLGGDFSDALLHHLKSCDEPLLPLR